MFDKRAFKSHSHGKRETKTPGTTKKSTEGKKGKPFGASKMPSVVRTGER